MDRSEDYQNDGCDLRVAERHDARPPCGIRDLQPCQAAAGAGAETIGRVQHERVRTVVRIRIACVVGAL